MIRATTVQTDGFTIASPPKLFDGSATSTPSLLVEISHLSARIGKTGQSYQLQTLDVARWLKILAERPGVWVSTAQLAQIDPDLSGQRVERLRKQLHRSLAKHVEVKRGKGARLMVQ